MTDLEIQILQEPETPKPTPAAKRPVPRGRRPKSAESSGIGSNVQSEAETSEFFKVGISSETPTGSEQAQSAKLVEKPDKLSDSGQARSGPPDLSEWQDFFARFVIRLLVNGYLFVVLGDLIDELSPRELKQIYLSKEDMSEMAAPLASMAHKSKFARKHGRTIVAFADSYESILNMLIWMRRVNKIARKYKKARQDEQPVQGQVIVEPTNVYSQGVNGNGRNVDGSDSGENDGVARPQFGVYNPGGG
jgi:hypothetical protein